MLLVERGVFTPNSVIRDCLDRGPSVLLKKLRMLVLPFGRDRVILFCVVRVFGCGIVPDRPTNEFLPMERFQMGEYPKRLVVVGDGMYGGWRVSCGNQVDKGQD